MIVAIECGCLIDGDEVECCVWHWQMRPCQFCGEPIGKDGHEDRDGEPVCDGCWDERLASAV